jgi:hypothetical protein
MEVHVPPPLILTLVKVLLPEVLLKLMLPETVRVLPTVKLIPPTSTVPSCMSRFAHAAAEETLNTAPFVTVTSSAAEGRPPGPLPVLIELHKVLEDTVMEAARILPVPIRRRMARLRRVCKFFFIMLKG